MTGKKTDPREKRHEMSLRRYTLLLALFLTLLPAVAQADEAAQLYGRKWMLIYMAGTPPAKEARAGMSIAGDGRINGTGGCNTFVGVAEVSLVHKTIFIGQLTSTLKGCAEDVMRQEIGFTAALRQANLWELEPKENKLHLMDEAGTRLLSFVADPVEEKPAEEKTEVLLPAIIGPEWVVEDIRKRGIIDRSHMTMIIGADGRIAGSAGCNRYFGQVSVSEGAIETRAVSSSRRACYGEALQKQEANFLRALDSARTWHIADTGLLYLKDSYGNEVLRFSKKSAPQKPAEE